GAVGDPLLGVELEMRANFASEVLVSVRHTPSLRDARSARHTTRLEHPRHGARDRLPSRFLDGQLLSAFRRETVELHLTTARVLIPRRRDQAVALEPL